MTEPTDAGPDPCPFCGSSNVVHYEVEGRDNHHFECCNCLASSMCKTTRQEALAAWNRRTPQPTQAQAGAVPRPSVELGPDGKEWAKTEAGYAHVDKMLPRADGHCIGPFWYGWAVRGAFVAGAEWQEARQIGGIKGADHG